MTAGCVLPSTKAVVLCTRSDTLVHITRGHITRGDLFPCTSVVLICTRMWTLLRSGDEDDDNADWNEAEAHQAKSSVRGGEDVEEEPQVYPEHHTRRARERRG